MLSLLAASTVDAFTIIPSRTVAFRCSKKQHTTLLRGKKETEYDENGFIKKNALGSVMDPVPTKIPPELKSQIYEAEANTQESKDRQTRVTLYAAFGFVFFCTALTNVMITESRETMELVQGTLPSATEVGWGIAEANPVLNFLLQSKVGGVLVFLLGGGLLLLAEAENDVKRQNAERIYAELKRRREDREANEVQSRKKRRNQPTSNAKGMVKASGKQRKRMAALAEMMVEEEKKQEEPEQAIVAAVEEPPKPATPEPKKEGMMDKLKSFYDKADSMAASQALLLNKELEDRGVVDKITDESGLKVIGKEAAEKLQDEKKADKKK